jgi:hypothetical protein
LLVRSIDVSFRGDFMTVNNERIRFEIKKIIDDDDNVVKEVWA